MLRSQTTTSCFEIESILADACGGSEGLNEMAQILIGPNDIQVSDLDIDWPNISNPFLGFCQNGTTASLTADINATITGCGEVLEPVGGILPANATVVIITSSLYDPALNPFTNLNETIYVLYQCGAETAGNFANSGANPRTLTITYNGPSGSCNDAVDRKSVV